MKGWRGPPRFGMRQGPRFPMRRQFQRQQGQQGRPMRMGGLGGQRRGIGQRGSQYRMRIQMRGRNPVMRQQGMRGGKRMPIRKASNANQLDKEMDSYWSKCNNKEIEEQYNFNKQKNLDDELEAYRNNFSTQQVIDKKSNELKANQTSQIEIPKGTVNQEL